jgi:hypothetical protein
MVWPCETKTSTCLSLATISSGLYLLLGISVLVGCQKTYFKSDHFNEGGSIRRGKVIEGRSYPYSPSPAGASKERALLDDAMTAVRNATAHRQWPPDDLKAATIAACKKMKIEGLLIEKDMKELISDACRATSRNQQGAAINRS